MDEPKQSHRTAIIVAVIGVVGAIAAAIVGPVVGNRVSNPSIERPSRESEAPQKTPTMKPFNSDPLAGITPFAGPMGGTYTHVPHETDVRDGPSFDAPIKFTLRAGTLIAVTAHGIEGDVSGDGIKWYPIKIEQGPTGWISSEDLPD